jgi:peptide/nickel transport system permease protein
LAAITTVSDERLASVEMSQAGLIWRRFRKHRLGVIGLTVLTLVVLSVIIVPIITPFDISKQNGSLYLKPIGATDFYEGNIPHLLGTDHDGRDFLKLLFTGGRSTLLVALIPTLAIVMIGSLLGAIAGYFGGWVDTAIMRGTDFISALPLLPAYLFAFRIIRPTREAALLPSDVPAIVATVALVFVIFGWMGICRMVRGHILSLRALPFVEAARALGADPPRIITRHLLPNSMAPIIVAATFTFGDLIIMESIITYFGLGLQMPTVPSWGNLIAAAQGQGYAWALGNLNPFEDIRPVLLFAPIFFVLITVLAINYIGDALRDAMDPHMRANMA